MRQPIHDLRKNSAAYARKPPGICGSRAVRPLGLGDHSQKRALEDGQQQTRGWSVGSSIMPAAHTGGHYARQPRGGCGWPRTLRLITSSMRQGEHGTTCGECVECDAREGPQKVGPWLGWGWEACVSRAQHERTYERTVVLTAATLWQGPEDRIDGVQEPLTGFSLYFLPCGHPTNSTLRASFLGLECDLRRFGHLSAVFSHML